MASEDDTAYKQLFAYPEMVRDLLLGFVPGEWIYIYLLLEFQSRSDHWMALRMQVYIGLLYQDLIKRHELPQPDRLPPVFPDVLYNGRRPWKACLNLTELVAGVPSDLRHLQATQQYLLIDQQRLNPSELALVDNFAALVFRIERTRAVSDLAIELEKLQRHVVTDGVMEIMGQWGARQLQHLAGERTIDLASSFERSAVMATPEFKTFGDIFRSEAELFGHKNRLKIMLIKRFGKLSRKLRNRIDWADMEDVDRWFDRLLDAKDIKEIFAEDVLA